MSRPSVLHLSTSDILGGSAKSAMKIHRGIQALGLESRMLVGRKSSRLPGVDELSKGFYRLADKGARRINWATGLQYALMPSTGTLLSHPWLQSADVVQIYNTHGEWLSHTILPALTAAKPTVWRLSDMWPATGHCAYAGDCGKWRTGCGGCPDLKAYPGLLWDTTRYLWNQKKRLYARSRIHIVAPSRWILEVAEQSPLLAPFPKSLIPNGLDTSLYRPMGRAESRRLLGIQEDRKALLFVANNALDPIKGGDLFAAAVNALWDAGRRDLMVLAVGANGEAFAKGIKAPVWAAGSVTDEGRMASIYSAADAYVHCALKENLPNTVLEAMACGTPVAAFDAGGVSQAVLHGETGLLAALGDVADLAKRLEALLEEETSLRLGGNCLELIRRDYTLEGQAKAFADLYRSLAAEAAAGAA